MPKFDLFKRADRAKADTATCGCDDCMTEFGEEFSTFDSHITKGISLNNEGSRLRLNYSGLLAKSGAQDVYAAVDYGDNRNWNNVEYYRMNNIGRGNFEVLLPVSDNVNLNVAFKDGANNWDNNSGSNYRFNSH